MVTPLPPRSITTCQVVTAVGYSREPATSSISLLVRFVNGYNDQNKALTIIYLRNKGIYNKFHSSKK